MFLSRGLTSVLADEMSDEMPEERVAYKSRHGCCEYTVLLVEVRNHPHLAVRDESGDGAVQEDVFQSQGCGCLLRAARAVVVESVEGTICTHLEGKMLNLVEHLRRRI